MGFKEFNHGIELIAGLKPFGDFPLIESCDILVGEENERLDKRLKKLGSVTKPKPISTEAEMNSILAKATEMDIGTIYKYTGTTTATYENGALYVITGGVLDGDGVSY